MTFPEILGIAAAFYIGNFAWEATVAVLSVYVNRRQQQQVAKMYKEYEKTQQGIQVEKAAVPSLRVK